MLLLATLLLGILANANIRAKANVKEIAKGIRQKVDKLQRPVLGLAKGGWIRRRDRVTRADMDAFAQEAENQKNRAVGLFLEGGRFDETAENRLKKIQEWPGYENMRVAFAEGSDDKEKLVQIREAILDLNAVAYKLAQDQKQLKKVG